MKIRKNEQGTYIENLINQYNSKINDGISSYETMKSLRKEIAERRKIIEEE